MSERFTYATLFTGGDGWGVGLRAAGGWGLWGVELDPAIAACATANGARNVHVADVRDVDWTALPAPDALCISQPCTRISGANTGAGETVLDIALARASLRAVETLLPRYVLVENVPPFAATVSARLLLDGLWAAGYWVQAGVVNAADFGVPQTRQRWIVRAVRGGWLPMLPAPVPWVGWYAAIADLVDSLPASAFAPWQLKRLPDQLTSAGYIIGGGNTSDASLAGTWHSTARPADAPMFTVAASETTRALLINGGNSTRDLTLRAATDPAFTVGAQGGRGREVARAFLVPDSQNKYGDGVRWQDDPAWTVTVQGASHARCAWLDRGRVVRMTIRALQRFQSFPDGYTLPAQPAIAAKINGNAVPPLLAERLIESLVAA